jgi:hypothetical protein
MEVVISVTPSENNRCSGFLRIILKMLAGVALQRFERFESSRTDKQIKLMLMNKRTTIIQWAYCMQVIQELNGQKTEA